MQTVIYDDRPLNDHQHRHSRRKPVPIYAVGYELHPTILFSVKSSVASNSRDNNATIHLTEYLIPVYWYYVTSLKSDKRSFTSTEFSILRQKNKTKLLFLAHPVWSLRQTL